MYLGLHKSLNVHDDPPNTMMIVVKIIDLTLKSSYSENGFVLAATGGDSRFYFVETLCLSNEWADRV